MMTVLEKLDIKVSGGVPRQQSLSGSRILLSNLKRKAQRQVVIPNGVSIQASNSAAW